MSQISNNGLTMNCLNSLLWILFLSSISVGFSQGYANEITKLERDFCIYTESVWYDDTLLVVGNSGIFASTLDATLVKYSKDGNLSSKFFIADSSSEFNFLFWHSGLLITEDEIIRTATKAYNNDESESMMVAFDLLGNFLDSASFKSYYYPINDRIAFTDFKKVPNGYIVTEISWKDYKDAQSCLRHLDNSFNEIWHRCFGNGSTETPKQVFPLSNGHFVVIANSTDLEDELFQGPGNRFHRGYIFEVDEVGNLKWEWRSPDRSEAIYAGYLENDTTLIVASGMGEEVCSQPGNPNSQCRFLWTGGVYKFNLVTKEKTWETRLSGGPLTTMFDNCYLDIIPSIEKDGYILSGAGYDQIPDCRTDTIDKCWANPGVIAKVSNNGDSLWLRKYFGVIDIYESNRLLDVEITPDSGYSFIGEAFNPWPGETQGQFGWLLMTDNYGCLVPGCQLISKVEDVESFQIQKKLAVQFKLFPNPLEDVMNILILEPISKKSQLKLFNSLGIELDSWSDFEQGGTYSIPTIHLSSGLYRMILFDENKILQTETVLRVDN